MSNMEKNSFRAFQEIINSGDIISDDNIISDKVMDINYTSHTEE